MATHSSFLAWRIPWTEEFGRLQSIGSQRVEQLTLSLISLSKLYWDFPRGPVHSPSNAAGAGLIPAWGVKSFPGCASGKEPTYPCRRHETRVQSLGQEDLLEKGMATYSSILAWRIPWTEEPGGLPSIESKKVGQDLKRFSTQAHRELRSHVPVAKKKKNIKQKQHCNKFNKDFINGSPK